MINSRILIKWSLKSSRALRLRSHFSVYSCLYNQGLPKLTQVTYEETLARTPSAELSTINNGLRIVTQKSSQENVCTVGLFVDCGSRHEDSDRNGIASFFERMAFRASLKKSRGEIRQTIEDMGAQLGSFTTRDKSAFYCRCLPKDVAKVTEILCDSIKNPKFEQADIDEVKRDMLCEMQEIESNPQAMLFDYLHATAYQGTPLGQSVLGKEEIVKNFEAADLERHVQESFQAPRVLAVATGNTEHNDFKNVVENQMSDLSISYPNVIPPYQFQTRFSGSELRHRNDDHPLTHGVIAIECPPVDSQDSLVFLVGANIMGNWDMQQPGLENHLSRLARTAWHKNFVEEGGANENFETCHAFEPFVFNYKDTGLWGLYYVCDQWSALDFFPTMQKEWMRLCTSVTDAEVERGKNILRTNLLRQSVSGGTLALANNIATHVFYYDRVISAQEMEMRIANINADRVKQVFLNYVYDNEIASACYGRVEAVPNIVRQRSGMWQFRF